MACLHLMQVQFQTGFVISGTLLRNKRELLKYTAKNVTVL